MQISGDFAEIKTLRNEIPWHQELNVPLWVALELINIRMEKYGGEKHLRKLCKTLTCHYLEPIMPGFMLQILK